jgi:hypothetical protein
MWGKQQISGCSHFIFPGTGLQTPQFFGRKADIKQFGPTGMIMPLLLSILAMFLVVSCELTSDFKELSAVELNKLISEGAQILIVDNRTEYEYNEGHIPKAINISQERFNSLNMLLPKDKAFPILFYCRGTG